MYKQILVVALLSSITTLPALSQKSNYKITKTFHVASPGGWDYLTVDEGSNKIYVSHGMQVNILDKTTGDSIGVILNTPGVHGIALDKKKNKGYTSNGRGNNVTVFDLKTNAPITQIATGENPDAIIFDSYSNKIITCNGKSKDLSVIDPTTDKVVATIAVGGRPEEAASNENGKLYVNLEDKSEIAEVDMKNIKVLNHWSLAPGEGPTGLAFDKATHRLFAACDKKLVVVNAENGKVVANLPIGDGSDGVAFDPASKDIFTSNGDGTMTVVHEASPNDFKVVETVTTKPRARTIALDKKTHTIYLPTAEFEKQNEQDKKERPKMIPGTFQVLVVKS
jgi:YVTN family beta-propeller protein